MDIIQDLDVRDCACFDRHLIDISSYIMPVTLNLYQFLTTKEMIYIVNLSSRNYLRSHNRWMPPIQEFLLSRRVYYRPEAPPALHPAQMGIMALSIEFENQYRAACLESDGAEAEYLSANITHASKLPLLINMPRHLLGWLRVYTATENEVESYFIPKGSLAPVAGGFIKAEFERYLT